MSKKRTTINEIAKLANVSKSTVSRVLNKTTPVAEDKREAVLSAMKELDYTPNLAARSLASGNSMTLGVVTQKIGSPFYDLITQGIIDGVTGSEYSPIFAGGEWAPEIELSAIETLVDRNVDGLILVGGHLDRSTMEEMCQSKPIIVVARAIEGWEDRCIAIDNVSAAREATELLINAGHHRIAHIMGPEEQSDAADRYTGYKAALKDAAIEIDEAIVARGNFSAQSGVMAVESFLYNSSTFSAIFASNDQMAQGACLALYRRGIRVPEDVSIVGFDDQPSSAYMTPPLTTVAQPAFEMGRAAATGLIGLLRGEELELPKLEAELVIRDSVGRVR